MFESIWYARCSNERISLESVFKYEFTSGPVEIVVRISCSMIFQISIHLA